MPDFIVKRGKINRDGKTYRPGDKISLPLDIADVLPQGRVEPVTSAAKQEEPLLDAKDSEAESPQGAEKGNGKKRR